LSSLIISGTVPDNHKVLPYMAGKGVLFRDTEPYDMAVWTASIVRRWDAVRWLLADPDVTFVSMVRSWQRSRLPGADQLPGYRFGHLEVENKVMSDYSVFNQIFGWVVVDGVQVDRTVFATSGIYSKLTTAYKKTGRSQRFEPFQKKMLIQNLAGALEIMYKFYLFTYDKFGTKRFEYSQTRINYDTIPLDKSAGIDFMTNTSRSIGDDVYVITSVGTKGPQLDRVKQQIQRAFEDLSLTDSPLPNYYTRVAIKQECYNEAGSNYQDLLKFHKKIRLLWVDNTLGHVTHRIIGEMRQKIERGTKNRPSAIYIGRSMWGGGAQRLAISMKYDSPDHEWGHADFRGLDTTIKAFFLGLMVTEIHRYVDMECTPIDSYLFLCYLLKYCGINLACKICSYFGDVWRSVVGVMPSGSFITSHGDSWMVLLGWCLFISRVIATHSLGDEIRLAVESGDYPLCITGDDHVIGYLKKWKHIVSHKLWVEFMVDFLGFEFRDVEVSTSFLSRVDFESGEAYERQVVFLKRIFIDVSGLDLGVPNIIHFRESHNAYFKMVYGPLQSRCMYDLLTSSIAFAYESSGVNYDLYDFARFLFTRASKQMSKQDENWEAAYIAYVTCDVHAKKKSLF